MTTSVILVNSIKEMSSLNTTGKKYVPSQKTFRVVLSFLWLLGSEQFLLIGSSNFEN